MRQYDKRSLRQSLAAVTRIHLFVNGSDPHAHAVGADEWRWVIPCTKIKDILKFIGPSRHERFVVIDGYEPFLDEKPLRRLVSLLSLWGWGPVVKSTGMFMAIASNPKRILERIARVGFFMIQLHLTAKGVNHVGLAMLSCLYREAYKYSLRIPTCYYLEDSKSSRTILQNLLSCDDVNRTLTTLCITPRLSFSPPNFAGQQLSVGLTNCTEVTLGHKGTLAVVSRRTGRIRHCSVFNPNWKEEVSSLLGGGSNRC